MKPLEIKLDDSKELPNIIEYKWSKKTKICFGLLIFFLILLIVFLVIILIGASKVKDER